MNEKQKRLFFAVIAIVVGMAVYPPFQFNWLGRTITGYAWIFALPFPGATVDVGMLVAQWAIVLGIGLVAFFLLGNRS